MQPELTDGGRLTLTADGRLDLDALLALGISLSAMAMDLGQAMSALGGAKAQGLDSLFVLTTRTEHWFVERGFKLVSVEDLPAKKRDMYNYQRRSKVLAKAL